MSKFSDTDMMDKYGDKRTDSNVDKRTELISKKVCRTCGVPKNKEQFRPERIDCKKCESIYATERQKLNPEKKLQWNKNYRQTPHGKEALKRRSKTYNEKYPEKFKAMQDVHTAIRNGSLVKKPCEGCGEVKVDAHHDDYAKTLEVRWLCKICHVKHHNNLTNLGVESKEKL